MKRSRKSKVFALCLSVMMMFQLVYGTAMYSYAEDETSDAAQTTQQEQDADTSGSQDADSQDADTSGSSNSSDSSSSSDSNKKGSTELYSYVKSIQLSKDGTNLESGSTVNSGDNIKISMNYTIPGTVYAKYDTYTYQLPSNVKVSEALSGNIRQGGNTVGTYTVSTSGLVTFKFNSDYNTSNDATSNTFELSVQAKYVSNPSSEEVKFKYEDSFKTIVVENTGDFTVKKTVTREFAEGLSLDSVLKYTVTISSEDGTLEDFNVSDTISVSREDTFDSVKLDKGSFEIVDNDGNKVNGYSVSVANDGRSYSITGLPKLGQSGIYTLTYNVNVSQVNDTNNTASVNNNVKVKSGDNEESADTLIYYEGKQIYKNYIDYIQSSGMRWLVYGYTNYADISGLVVTDEATANISSIASIKIYDSGNNATSLSVKDVKIDGNKFTYTFPERDYSKIKRWEIIYYTKAEESDFVNGELEVNNTVNIKALDGSEWNKTITGTGHYIAADVSKDYVGDWTDSGNGYYTMNWKFNVDYTGLQYQNSASVKITDSIAAIRYYDDSNSNNIYWNYNGVTQDHYTYASVLDKELKEGLKITVTDDDGNTTVMSYAEAVAAGYTVKLEYSNGSNSETLYKATDSTNKIRKFYITITAPSGENLHVTNVSIDNYTTRVSKQHLQNATRWRISNSISTLNSIDEAVYYYTRTQADFEKLVKAGVPGNNQYWTDEEATINYTNNGGQTEFLLLATVPDDQTEITITDTLPEGLTLQTDEEGNVSSSSIKVGPYTGYTIRSSLWTSANRSDNLEIKYDKETNKVTITAKNLGTALPFAQSSYRVVGVQLICDIENLTDLDDTTISKEDNAVKATHTFTNAATYNGQEESAAVTVVQNKNVLKKVGEQVTTEDGSTSNVKYTVTINKAGLDLLEDSDVLTLTDTITSKTLNLELDRNIKLYKLNDDGSKGDEVKLTKVSIKQVTENAGTYSQTFSLEVPDGTPLILEYEYEVGSESGYGKLDNTVELKGIINTSANTSVRNAVSSATSDHASLTLKKVDSENNTIYLDNAKFKLEKYNKDTGSYETVIEEFDVSGNTGKVFDFYAEDNELEGNTLYRVVETQAPQGYELPKDGAPFYFIIKGNIETGDASQITVSTDAEAKAAAEAPDGIEINYLAPSKGSYFDLENTAIKRTEISVDVSKKWTDNNDQDGIRPDAVTVNLLANGGLTGKSLVLNSANDWTGSFDGLYDVDEDGNEIKYTVEEVEVAGYTSEITGSQSDGYEITNTHLTETVDVSGTKTWNDNDNQDGVRPESIKINLQANGQVVDSQTVTEADDWSWNFTELPKYNAGTEIKYTIVEDVVDNYTTEYDGYNVTNTHAPGKTSVTVTKSWNDSDDQDGIRPDAVTVKLLANGEDTGKTLELSADNNWTSSFTELDKKSNGEEIEYTVEEETVSGYEVAITGNMTDGFLLTNSHTTETVDISGTKTWSDSDNQDGVRPESIEINLLADGEVVDTKTVTESDDWSWTFTGVAKYKDHGTEIVYSVTEKAIDNYSATYDGYNVTNTHTPDQTSVTVTKAWSDSNDKDGIRPDSVTVKLLADGEDTGKTLELSADNNWTSSFTELDKYKNGEAITYSVEEVSVDGYNSVVSGNQTDGYVITNSHTPKTTTKGNSPTTGDQNMLLLAFALLLLSMIAAVSTVLYRRSHN